MRSGFVEDYRLTRHHERLSGVREHFTSFAPSGLSCLPRGWRVDVTVSAGPCFAQKPPKQGKRIVVTYYDDTSLATLPQEPSLGTSV